MTILIVIVTLVGTTFLIYQLHKYIKEKNEDTEQSITIEDFANVYFIDDKFTVGKDAQANALQHLGNITQSNSFYPNHEEDWIQSYEYDEYEEWFESEEETADRLSIEMLEDELIYEDDYEDCLLDFEDENDNLYEDEIDYFDEEEFLSKFYDEKIDEQDTQVTQK